MNLPKKNPIVSWWGYSTAETPYSNVSVITTRYDLVFTEGNATDSTAMPEKSCGAFSLLQIPHLCNYEGQFWSEKENDE